MLLDLIAFRNDMLCFGVFVVFVFMIRVTDRQE